MSYRGALLTCVCLSTLLSCGHPIRDLANAAKDLIPEREADDAPGCAARASARIELTGNLRAGSAIAPSWDPGQPERTSSFAARVSAYAGEDASVEVRLFFARTGEGSWEWHALAGQPATEQGNGELRFDAEGALLEETTTLLLRLPRADGSLSAPVVLWLGTPKSADADGFDGVTSTSETSQLIGYEQDGRAAGACSDG